MSGKQLTRVISRLGQGWNFPIQPDVATRNLLYADGPDKVRQSIWIILNTNPGERIMRPQFGCGLRRYLMKPNTVTTRTLIQRDVEQSLRTWEPRVELQQVRVDTGDDPSLILISIAYVHRRDRSAGNLVFPFYLE